MMNIEQLRVHMRAAPDLRDMWFARQMQIFQWQMSLYFYCFTTKLYNLPIFSTDSDDLKLARIANSSGTTMQSVNAQQMDIKHYCNLGFNMILSADSWILKKIVYIILDDEQVAVYINLNSFYRVAGLKVDEILSIIWRLDLYGDLIFSKYREKPNIEFKCIAEAYLRNAELWNRENL
jgi:hypothetical protein